MKFFLSVALVAVSLAPSYSETEDPEAGPSFQEAVNAFALKPPDEASPFFSDRELARRERQESTSQELTGGIGPNETAIYPRVRDSNNSAAKTFTGFFTNMFSSIRVSPFRKKRPVLPQIQAEPKEFSLADRREIEVTYSLRNQTRKMMRLDFPTTQRIEILTRNENMEMIERWSDDRAFQEEEGIIFINPGERISYTEPVPTREMKPGQLQTISADLVGYPEYSDGTQITPSP